MTYLTEVSFHQQKPKSVPDL